MKSTFSLAVLILFFVSSCISEKDMLAKIDISKSVTGKNVQGTFKNCNLSGKEYGNLADLLYGFKKIRFMKRRMMR